MGDNYDRKNSGPLTCGYDALSEACLNSLSLEDFKSVLNEYYTDNHIKTEDGYWNSEEIAYVA